MHVSRQRTHALRAPGVHRTRRLRGVLTRLIPLAMAACRGDRPLAEAMQQETGAPASPVKAERPEEQPRPAPPAGSIPAPWYLTVQPSSGGGVKVTGMDIRSFAAPLIEPGDVILAVDGRPVHSADGLMGYLRACSPGEIVVLTVLRRETRIHYALLQVPEDDPPVEQGG